MRLADTSRDRELRMLNQSQCVVSSSSTAGGCSAALVRKHFSVTILQLMQLYDVIIELYVL